MNMDILFNQALLAEASYAYLWDEEINQVIKDQDKVETALKASGLSETQAESFSKNWEVISHQPDTDSRFSATLFKNRKTGEYVFSNRGTLD